MLSSRPPIMAARLGRVGSQSCETLDARSVATNRSGKKRKATKGQGTFTHQAIIGVMGFFIGRVQPCNGRDKKERSFAQSKPWVTVGRRVTGLKELQSGAGLPSSVKKIRRPTPELP